MSKKISSRAGWQVWQQALSQVRQQGGRVSSYGALFVTSEYAGRGQLPHRWDEFLWKAYCKEMVEAIVYSYETPIAFCVDGNWVMPATKYSKTTSKHQNLIFQAADCRQTDSISEDDDAFYELLDLVFA
jgi:hypothetical protein